MQFQYTPRIRALAHLYADTVTFKVLWFYSVNGRRPNPTEMEKIQKSSVTEIQAARQILTEQYNKLAWTAVPPSL